MAPKKAKQLGLADAGVLKKIDALFRCNVGHHISLPQIVVVGNQSSGKSSVLEGLTNLPFPKDSGLCTRFATQITFKRASQVSISVTVIPAKDASKEHIAKCRTWKKTLDHFEPSEFATIMESVNNVMGISATAVPPKTFSEDVLSIEVNGPDEEHLSVIDVPGIFKKVTDGVTTRADMQMVNIMVESYIQNPRSIILAVVPANVDIATQEILDIAEKHDPEGQRTLGVLTKPDLVDEGAEDMILDLLSGRAHKLALGWCILRNLGQKESQTAQDRNALEKAFFATVAPWTQVEKSKVGVEALRSRLGRLLVMHTRREFPKVKAELEKLLKESRSKLEGLGPQRTTTAEQASYLVKIASDFRTRTNMALDASYHAEDSFVENKKLRLANNIVLRSEQFATEFAKYGHDYVLHDTFSVSDNEAESDDESSDEEVEGFFARKTLTVHSDVSDIVDDRIPLIYPAETGASQWLKNLYTTSRGFELGTFDPKLLAMAMKQQSTKWPNLIRGYVSDIICLTHDYILQMLCLLCPDERVRSELLGFLMEQILQGYKMALRHVDFIVGVERSIKPMTHNHYFNENLQQSRDKRVTEALDAQTYELSNGTKVVNRAKANIHKNMSNASHIVQEIHDILKAYYKVARKRIVDVVIMQAVDYHLISGETSPLKVLCPEFISMLNNDELAQIAGEDEYTKLTREELQKTIDELQKGKKILQSS